MSYAHYAGGQPGYTMSRSAADHKPSSSQRRATNVTLPEDLLREAREIGINLSQACERGIAAEVSSAREQRWLVQNREAMDAWNEHITAHGLPLAAYRSF